MRKAYDMATEGQLIAMVAEQFKETGTKIAERGTDVGLDYPEENVDAEGEGMGDGGEDWVRKVVQDGNGNEKGRGGNKNDDNGKTRDNGEGKARQHDGWNSQGAVVINLVDTESDPDL